MKVGIVGIGYVGIACAKAMMLRGSCSEIVLIDIPSKIGHTQGVCDDLSHGEPLCPPTRLQVGEYVNLIGAAAVIITAGIAEREEEGATNKGNEWGRQHLLPHNAEVYREIVPKVVAQTSDATIVVVTDPPDTLADVAAAEVRRVGGKNLVLSSGTYLDTLRFRIQIAKAFECSARSVNAFVIGEHGKTQVYVWSSAQIGGIKISQNKDDKLGFNGILRSEIEKNVIDANINIIDATGASQHGIGVVTARIVEALLRDERIVAPVGTFQEEFGVTLSLPSVIGRNGIRVLKPSIPSTLDEIEENTALRNSAAYLAEALRRCRDGAGFSTPPKYIIE